MPEEPARYWLTRFVFLRFLGLVYFFAFLCALGQFLPLVGEHGLLPAHAFLEALGDARGSGASWMLPTLFWLDASDAAMRAAIWAGLALSLALLCGLANVPSLAALWLLYMSLVHVGQIFYGYGWEILLLEAGFLAIFMAPLWRAGPFPERSPTPEIVVWLLRWLVFRVMLGAGLIKLRGDPCWRDLTCLVYHYETQPIPNPLSWYFHHLPGWFHAAEVLFNHVVELALPWLVFGPRRARHAAGVLLVAFQLLLILSGNLSFLNWLTIAICIPCFDDRLLAGLLPGRLAARAEALRDHELSRARFSATAALAVVVGLLSFNPVANMLSPGQVMNTSFDPLHLVNTYGAFGSVGRVRHEVVLQGTNDPQPDASARWFDYELPCKPGDVERVPCVTSPYHRRLDWQMWFAAMSDAESEPWLIRVVDKLLQGDAGTLSLFASGRLPAQPPRFVRAELFRYEFTRPGEGPAWWRRTHVRMYLPALSADDPVLRNLAAAYGEPR